MSKLKVIKSKYGTRSWRFDIINTETDAVVEGRVLQPGRRSLLHEQGIRRRDRQVEGHHLHGAVMALPRVTTVVSIQHVITQSRMAALRANGYTVDPTKCEVSKGPWVLAGEDLDEVVGLAFDAWTYNLNDY